MIVYGIDPGTTSSAIVGIDEFYDIVLHDHLNNLEMEALLAELSNPTDILSIEWVQSYGMAVGQDVFLTCRAVGRFEKSWKFQENVYLYARPAILSYITGGVRVKGKKADSQVRQSLMLRFGGTKKGEPLHGISKHKWSAVAVGIYALDKYKIDPSNLVDLEWTLLK